MNYAVKIRGLCFRYPEKENNVLEDVNFSLKCGEIAAVIGPSGSGKTTLCYCITGIIPHILGGEIDGSACLFGRDVREMKVSQIATIAGMVFEDPDSQLFSPTVEDEIAFGPENLCVERIKIGKRINESLDMTGMQSFRYGNPSNLSGGEKQLIAISSVLSLEPRILVLDEPMSLLDRDGRHRIMKLIKRLKEQDRAIIIAGNDHDNINIADQVLVLDGGRLENSAGYGYK